MIAIRSAHIRHIERASTRRIRQMTNAAVYAACAEVRKQGAEPITMVDDLSVHRVGRWIGKFAVCLTRSARREGISIVGGEMAQMPDTYKSGYAGVTATVVGLARARGEAL